MEKNSNQPNKILASLARKQTGIKLVILGVFLGIFILSFFYLNTARVPGFSEFLPAEETVGYIRFPTRFENAAGKNALAELNKNFDLNWSTDIEPWTGQNAALAFLSNAEDSEKLIPVALFQPLSGEGAFAFLKTYKNSDGVIEEFSLNGITAYRTPVVHFAFVSDILVVARSEIGLSIILSHQSSLSRHLAGDSDFIKVHQNTDSDIFVFLRPNKLPRATYQLLSTKVPRMPFLKLASPAIGISAERSNENGKLWRGKFYTTLADSVPLEAEQAYKALLLKFLPTDFHLLLAGQNLPAQLKKTEANDADTELLIDLFMDEYFPEIDFGETLAPLLQGEFASTVNSKTDGEKVLFITEITNKTISNHIETLRAAFNKNTGQYVLTARDVTLPDGTEAEELVPTPQSVRTFHEEFSGITIGGFDFGGKSGIYDAVTQNKWFVSNDIEALKKSLALTQDPGEQFHNSELYRNSLQSILKNPELLGVAELREGTFGFSKRTFTDHIETGFTFLLK